MTKPTLCKYCSAEYPAVQCGCMVYHCWNCYQKHRKDCIICEAAWRRHHVLNDLCIPPKRPEVVQVACPVSPAHDFWKNVDGTSAYRYIEWRYRDWYRCTGKVATNPWAPDSCGAKPVRVELGGFWHELRWRARAIAWKLRHLRWSR